MIEAALFRLVRRRSTATPSPETLPEPLERVAVAFDDACV
jgi:hypothetical protein